MAAVEEVGEALRGDRATSLARGLLANIDEVLEDGTQKEVLRSLLSGVVDFEARRQPFEAADALICASGLPFNLLDLLEDTGELEPMAVARRADVEVARQVRDLEPALDGHLALRWDERVCE